MHYVQMFKHHYIQCFLIKYSGMCPALKHFVKLFMTANNVFMQNHFKIRNECMFKINTFDTNLLIFLYKNNYLLNAYFIYNIVMNSKSFHNYIINNKMKQPNRTF